MGLCILLLFYVILFFVEYRRELELIKIICKLLYYFLGVNGIFFIFVFMVFYLKRRFDRIRDYMGFFKGEMRIRDISGFY